MFGGNPGANVVGSRPKAASNMRLDDLWRLQVTVFGSGLGNDHALIAMQLLRRSKATFLREWQLSLRKQRY